MAIARHTREHGVACAHERWVVHDGHLEIQHERVGAVLAKRRERLPAVAHRVHFIAVLTKGIANYATNTGSSSRTIVACLAPDGKR
jgi:hypothetical protein